MVTEEEAMARDDYDREQEEKARHEAGLDAEYYAKQQEGEAMAKHEHEEEVKNNPLKIIINAIIEQQERGQINPQTMDDLKTLLNNIEVIKAL